MIIDDYNREKLYIYESESNGDITEYERDCMLESLDAVYEGKIFKKIEHGVIDNPVVSRGVAPITNFAMDVVPKIGSKPATAVYNSHVKKSYDKYKNMSDTDAYNKDLEGKSREKFNDSKVLQKHEYYDKYKTEAAKIESAMKGAELIALNTIINGPLQILVSFVTLPALKFSKNINDKPKYELVQKQVDDAEGIMDEIIKIFSDHKNAQQHFKGVGRVMLNSTPIQVTKWVFSHSMKVLRILGILAKKADAYKAISEALANNIRHNSGGIPGKKEYNKIKKDTLKQHRKSIAGYDTEGISKAIGDKIRHNNGAIPGSKISNRTVRHVLKHDLKDANDIDNDYLAKKREEKAIKKEKKAEKKAAADKIKKAEREKARIEREKRIVKGPLKESVVDYDFVDTYLEYVMPDCSDSVMKYLIESINAYDIDAISKLDTCYAILQESYDGYDY